MLITGTRLTNFAYSSARLVLDSESDALSEAASQSTRILAPDIIRQYAETICMGNESMVDKDSDIKSMLSAVFTEASIESSVSSSCSEIRTLTVLQLADLLRNDDEMAVLYPKATSKLGSSRFQRNFTRFLKQFSKNLDKEATNELQRHVVGIIRHYAQRTAHEVAEKFQPRGLDDAMSRPGGEEITKKSEVNEWITSHNWLQNPPRSGLEGLENDRKPDDEASPKDDGLFDESDSSASSEIDGYSIRSLREIEHFLVSSQAFLTLRKEFRQWLRLDEGEEGEEGEEDDSCTASAGSLDVEYDLCLSLNLFSGMTNMLKRMVEHIASCRLSWWPLTAGERIKDWLYQGLLHAIGDIPLTNLLLKIVCIISDSIAPRTILRRYANSICIISVSKACRWS